MLCAVCLSIFKAPPSSLPRVLRRDAFKVHHQDIASLRKSYWDHCHICVLLRRMLPPGRLHDIEELITKSGTTEPITQFRLTRKSEEEPVSLSFIVSLPLPGSEEKRATFELLPAQMLGEVASSSLPDNTGSRECIELAKRWLHDCKLNHKRCNNMHTSLLPEASFLPTRLVDIGNSDSAAIRLAITEEDHVQGPYMTLSHCWGDALFLQLTQTTFSSLRGGIPFETLPVTFREAIHVARQLGVRYLWIDSLCIYQDSRSDWRSESSAMGDIYRGGTCNIAATGARFDGEGLFFERDGTALAVPVVETDWGAKQSFVLFKKDGIWTDLSSARLLQRAWVVQERYMSKRLLHFNKRELIWECSELSACERFPAGLQYEGMTSRPFGALQTRDFFWFEAEKTPRGWRRLVDIYSHCEMTKEEDKLVALSGIVKEIQSKRDARYLAGMWSTSLFEDMLWRVRRPRVPKHWRAPTWSWACVDGIINWPRYLNADQKLAQHPAVIMDTETKHPTSDHTGEVISASMRIRGPLLSITMQIRDATEDEKVDSVFVNGKWTTVSEDSLAFDWVEAPQAESVQLTMIVLRRAAFGPSRRLSNAGLLLMPTDIKGYYRRVGRVYTYDKNWVNGLPSDLNHVSNEDWLTDHVDTVDDSGRNMYTLTIL